MKELKYSGTAYRMLLFLLAGLALSSVMIYSACATSKKLPASQETEKKVSLSYEEVKKMIEHLERIEAMLNRAPRPGPYPTSADNPVSPFDDTQIAELLSCCCFVKNLLIQISGTIGNCTDVSVAAITGDGGAACVSTPEIDGTCASIISWLKTIESELRGNQTSCP
jgi:hypothetical protein